MPICPKCHAEFEDGTESCPTCGVPLLEVVPGVEPGWPDDAVPIVEDGEPLKLLMEVSLPEMAGMIQEFLQNCGIRCWAHTDSMGLLYRLPAPLASSRVFVRESDFEEARELISHFFNPD